MLWTSKGHFVGVGAILEQPCDYMLYAPRGEVPKRCMGIDKAFFLGWPGENNEDGGENAEQIH